MAQPQCPPENWILVTPLAGKQFATANYLFISYLAEKLGFTVKKVPKFIDGTHNQLIFIHFYCKTKYTVHVLLTTI